LKPAPNPLVRLQDLAEHVEAQGTLEDNLDTLARMTAGILNAEACSILLLSEGDASTPKLRVWASSTLLPDAAYAHTQSVGEGIAGHVVLRGEPLLVHDIAHSPFARHARRPDEPRRGLIAAPIAVHHAVIGVVTVSLPRDGRIFGHDDLSLLIIVALFIGKSIQVAQLQGLLKSRFALHAMATSGGKASDDGLETGRIDATLSGAVENPERVARMLAKSFYRELTQAGFGPRHIINAATEIIGMINTSIGKHRERQDKQTQTAAPDAQGSKETEAATAKGRKRQPKK
jgi:signal transduction protein with GAF and PtsI domain